MPFLLSVVISWWHPCSGYFQSERGRLISYNNCKIGMTLCQDDNGPTVSGAAVDAFAERLKGELSGAAAAAYGLARAGNGSLRSITSLNPAQAPATSSIPPATGSFSGTVQPSLTFVWLILTCVHFSFFLFVSFPNIIVRSSCA